MKPTSRIRLVNRWVKAVIGAVLVASMLPAPASATPLSATKLTHVTVILGWYAEPARAGFYAAQMLGYYKKAGLEASLLAGADVSPEQVVGAGRAQFGYDDADAILQTAAQGVPIVAIAASYQQYPFILLYHSGSGVHSFSNLGHRTAYIFPGSLYWEYIVKKYNLKGVKQVAYSGSLTPFATNASAINQGYLGVENVTAAAKGIHVGYLRVSQSGYNPYSNVIFAMRPYMQAHPGIVRAFVKATIKGWNAYKTDYKAVDKYMQQFNKAFPASAMDKNAVDQEPLVYGGAAATHGVGYMTLARWQKVASDLQYIGALKKSVNLKEVFTDSYLHG